ncbi:MAG: oligosaccharide flippase family protein [Hamadaea sp.]|uniref:oligosaccharide flippase family protein n=1 Tax=Hamadaea sp. NPDC050747 TaxID=3155789 RepID=UPI0017DE3A13|nr:oligosaccharide flippase family protein [Hamadaea sp.]NUR51570.1 oligosaccharide flippase family protein [Hamadaea sp.]NUR71332.1 oligosaccharide flippase family protein [Hamadaea sp.]NUT05813.1 oligosaccharide flippase family protein [Hamadaea sp.]
MTTTVTEEEQPGGLRRLAGKGLSWSLLGTVGTKIASFGVGLILARLLTPADFGGFAVASAVAFFATHISDMGIIAGVVQWRGLKGERHRDELGQLLQVAPSATSLALLFSVAIYGAVWIGAPGLGALAGGDVDAANLIRLLSVAVLIDGLTAVRAAALMRRFQQDKLTKANFAGFVASAVLSIALALAGAGAYAFAVGQVAGAAVTGLMVMAYAKLNYSLGLDRKIVGALMKFGLPLTASMGVEAVVTNADYIIVGRYLGGVALGYYLLAFNISGWAQGIVGSAIRYVSIAAFSRLAGRGDDSFARGVQKSLKLLILGVVPICVLMAVLAPQLVHVLYGPKWLPAVIVLQFLTVLTGVRLVTSFALDTLAGAGISRSALWVNLGWTVALVPTLIIATQVDGTRGTAIAHGVVSLLVALPLCGIALRKAGVHLWPVVRSAGRPLLAGAVAGIAAHFVVAWTGLPPAADLVAAGAAGAVLYVAVAIGPSTLRRWAARLSQKPADALT